MTTIVIPNRRQLAVAIDAGSSSGSKGANGAVGFSAGDVVYGHVHFEFQDEKEVPGVHHRLQLWLMGYERTCINDVVTREATPAESLREDNSQDTLVLKEVESEQLVFHAKLEETRFAMARIVGNLAEVRFQGRLPQNLPSGSHIFEARAGDGDVGVLDFMFNEKHQELVKYSNKLNQMQLGYDLIVMINKDETADTPIEIRGAKSDAHHEIEKLPLRGAVERFSIVSNLLWRQGKISFGFHSETDTGHPHAVLALHIQLLQHQCKVAVRNFKVKWTQHISFWSNDIATATATGSTFVREVVEPTIKTIEYKQILLEDTILVGKKNDGSDNSTPHMMTMYLKLPGKGCFNTYDGKLMKIHHTLTVIAETDKKNTTNPKITETVYWYN